MVDTRFLFRPVAAELVGILERLQPDDFERPTLAPLWRVRDIVAHLTDTHWRRLSFQRDRLVPPPPPGPIASERDLTAMINRWNNEFVDVFRRFSGRVLAANYAAASRQLADFFESLPLDAPALFPVSWAGESASAGWFDIGREFTELWHHQMQIRDAVGEPPLADPRYLRAVLEIAVLGLPHAYRAVAAPAGTVLVIRAVGPAGGEWTLRCDARGWRIVPGGATSPEASAVIGDEALGRLLFNALGDGAAAAVAVDGRRDLVEPLLRARSVIV
ncbi:MAG: maleylpyruvate isomerase family mycothiol-dependent enzyme [Vicinamibacterales bacterium]